MLHYYAAQFFAPAALSADVESGELVVYLMQDRLGTATPTVLSLLAYSWADNSAPIGLKNITIDEVRRANCLPATRTATRAGAQRLHSVPLPADYQ